MNARHGFWLISWGTSLAFIHVGAETEDGGDQADESDDAPITMGNAEADTAVVPETEFFLIVIRSRKVYSAHRKYYKCKSCIKSIHQVSIRYITEVP